MARWCRALAVMTACSVIPSARMIGAPKNKSVCQCERFTTINAKIGTISDTPIKTPARKLPTSRRLVGEFINIGSDPPMIAFYPRIVRAVPHSRRNEALRRATTKVSCLSEQSRFQGITRAR
jgi:hypothetical protein